MRRPSWNPGYYGLELGEATARSLAAVADVMIPGDDNYPPATEAGVVEFVEQRMNPTEHEALEKLMAEIDASDPDAIAAWLGRLETEERSSFDLLQLLLYTAYYRDEEVVRAIGRRGYDYHASPQPYGYEVPEDIPLPDGTRGGYVPTEEVRHAEL